MLSVANMFITESIYQDTKEILSKYFNMPTVKNFIDLSKKVVQDGVGSLSNKEQSTYRGLFDDPAVQDYITAARKTGTRNGWIHGGMLGGVSGGALGSIAGIGAGVSNELGTGGTFAAFIALGLLGAAAGGAALGWSFSKVNNILAKWRAEDDVIKLGRVGGQIGKTTPIIRTDM